jgi:hypothetical protein
MLGCVASMACVVHAFSVRSQAVAARGLCLHVSDLQCHAVLMEPS